MSSEGLPVNNVVGTSVDLDVRNVQGTANAALSSQSADSAAFSADRAWKFSNIALEGSQVAAGAVDESKAAAELSSQFSDASQAAAEEAKRAAATAADEAAAQAGAAAQQAIDDAIRQSGYTPIDSFEEGATLELVSSALRWVANNNTFYSWRGLYPKQVPFGSTPETTGGFAPDAWVDVSDLTFRTQVAAVDGLKLIGYVNGVNELISIATQDGDRVQLFDVTGRTNTRAPAGGGVLRFDAHVPKSKHDGFVNFSPTVPFVNISSYLDGTGETDPGGMGVFVRELSGNEVRLSYCGIYGLTDGHDDITLATKACQHLFKMCSQGFSVVFDVKLYVCNVEVVGVNYTINARAEEKLMLGDNGRILKLHNGNQIKAGLVTLTDFEFDGNGKRSVEDGGILQSNYISDLRIINPKIYNYVSNGYQANGIATTGIDCGTLIDGGDLSRCGSQLAYTQTSRVTINNVFFHDSPGHAVAIVNTSDLYWTGGSVRGCDYGVLTYSTATYRSSLRRLHISGVSMRGNNKAFEIARRYESAEVSLGEADIVLTDIDATGCTLPSTIGNLSTDNIDGFSIRGVHLNNIFTDSYVQCHSVLGLYVTGGRGRGLRVRGKYDTIILTPSVIYGDGSSQTTNTAVYIYASATGKDVVVNASSYQGLNSFIFAESGFVSNGDISINNPRINPAGMSYKVNNTLYGYVSCNSGNRTRDLSRQAWGVGKTFWDDALKKVLVWDGTNVTDTSGNIIT